MDNNLNPNIARLVAACESMRRKPTFGMVFRIWLARFAFIMIIAIMMCAIVAIVYPAVMFAMYLFGG